MIIRAKRSMAYLNNQRSMTPPRLYGKKGLTTARVDAIIKEQLEFNFNK